MSKPDREAMLDRDHAALSIRRQCQLLSLSRSGVYRPKRVCDDDDQALMRRLDELYTAHPGFARNGGLGLRLTADWGRCSIIGRTPRSLAPPRPGRSCRERRIDQTGVHPWTANTLGPKAVAVAPSR
jgi:hypothetical protein